MTGENAWACTMSVHAGPEEGDQAGYALSWRFYATGATIEEAQADAMKRFREHYGVKLTCPESMKIDLRDADPTRSLADVG